MLAVARALIGAPQVLMLDEPSAGLSPKLVGDVFEKLEEIRASGVAILLVEQNVKAALARRRPGGGAGRRARAARGPAAALARRPACCAALYLGAGGEGA